MRQKKNILLCSVILYCIHNAFKNCIIFLVLHCIKGNNLTTISADRLVAACSHGTFLLLAFRVPSGFTFKQRHILIQLLDICRSTPHGEYLMGISCQNTGGFFFLVAKNMFQTLPFCWSNNKL